MPNVYSDVLMEVAGETLEQLAFIFSFPDEMEPDAIWAESVIGCHVTFNGQAQGGLLMLISAAALPELAANMLGLDEDETPPEDQQQDALREALNVICGNLLPRVGGVEAVFNIQKPEILEAEAAKAMMNEYRSDPRGYASALLSLDEGECQLYLRSE
jgi:chemotaxis protein CheY-P-specific phosphatase CheC